MDTRLLRPWMAACAALSASCTSSLRTEGPRATPVASGVPEEFGARVLWARPSSLVLELAAPAYVTVTRFGAVEVGELVYPLASPDWLDFGYPRRGAPPERLEAGQHRLDLPLPWLRVDLMPAARRAPPRDACRFRRRAWACSSWPAWHLRQRDRVSRYYGPLPPPDSLVEHHLVVLVSAAPLRADTLRARLDQLHQPRVSAAAAAQAAPHFLTAGHASPWAAYAVTVRIYGVR